MKFLFVALFAVALAAQSWDIHCGFYDVERDFKWTVYRCFPSDLTVNLGDNVTFHQDKAANSYILNSAERVINFDTFQLNSLCILGRAQPDPPGGPEVAPSTSIVHPPDFLMTINSNTTPYSSGVILDVNPETMAVYASGETPAPPAHIPNWLLNMNATGVYTWHGCFESYMTGTITVLEAGAVLPKTVVEVQTESTAYFAGVKAKIVELEDLNGIGDGKYQDPITFINEEGFTHHIIDVGFADPETDIGFYGYIPPKITIVEGDTVAFAGVWFRSPIEDPLYAPLVHTVRFNVSINDPTWVPTYNDPNTGVAPFVIPQPGGGLFFVPYFPYYMRLTFLGLYDSPNTWTTTLADPRNFGNGELSLGGVYAKVRRGWQNYRNVTFVNPGVFPYVCYLHIPVQMRGEITVVARTPSTRDRHEVDVTLNRLTQRIFYDHMSTTWGTTYVAHAQFTFVAADHGILSFTLADGSAAADPLLVSFRVKFTVIDNNNVTDTELDEFGTEITNFVATKTWTPANLWTASIYVDEANTRTATTVEVVYTLSYNSAAVWGSSLLLVVLCVLSLVLF